MNLQLAVGFGGMLVALLFLVGSLLIFGRVFRRLQLEFRQLKDDVERIDMRYEQLEKRLKETFSAIEQRILQLNQMVADIKTMKEDSMNLIKKAETPIFVYSDRWTTADSEFLIAVENSAMAARPINKWAAKSWMEGRTYLVWAPNSEIAMRNLQIRFSVAAGYEVGTPVPSPLGLGVLWDLATTA